MTTPDYLTSAKIDTINNVNLSLYYVNMPKYSEIVQMLRDLRAASTGEHEAIDAALAKIPT